MSTNFVGQQELSLKLKRDQWWEIGGIDDVLDEVIMTRDDLLSLF